MPAAARDQEKFVVRLPDGFRRELKIRAAHNDRSVNGEIVNMLKSVIEAEKTASEHVA